MPAFQPCWRVYRFPAVHAGLALPPCARGHPGRHQRPAPAGPALRRAWFAAASALRPTRCWGLGPALTPRSSPRARPCIDHVGRASTSLRARLRESRLCHAGGRRKPGRRPWTLDGPLPSGSPARALREPGCGPPSPSLYSLRARHGQVPALLGAAPGSAHPPHVSVAPIRIAMVPVPVSAGPQIPPQINRPQHRLRLSRTPILDGRKMWFFDDAFAVAEQRGDLGVAAAAGDEAQDCSPSGDKGRGGQAVKERSAPLLAVRAHAVVSEGRSAVPPACTSRRASVRGLGADGLEREAARAGASGFGQRRRCRRKW